jgi:hypothetical protein
MFSGQALKISTVISCLSAAVILDLQTAAAQSVPQPAGDRILHQCEKELARDGLRELAKSLLKGGTIAGGSYKAYKLSNTVEQKDVVQFLKEHGLRDWKKTIRTVAPRIKSIVTGKVFRGGSVVGMVVGGAMVFLSWNKPAEASTTVGSPGRTAHSDEDFGPYDSASQPTDKTANPVITAPMVQLGNSQRERFEDSANTIKREFGDKYWLAIWFADYSIAKYNEAGGHVIIYSRLQTCSDEKKANPERVQSAASALQVCLLERTMPVCLFEQEPVKNTLKNILSQISINNDEISWDPRKFEGD